MFIISEGLVTEEIEKSYKSITQILEETVEEMEKKSHRSDQSDHDCDHDCDNCDKVEVCKEFITMGKNLTGLHSDKVEGKLVYLVIKEVFLLGLLNGKGLFSLHMAARDVLETLTKPQGTMSNIQDVLDLLTRDSAGEA